MLATLLESQTRHQRSAAQVLVSIAAHTALIGAALYATANARSKPERPAQQLDLRLVYNEPAPRKSSMPGTSGQRRNESRPADAWRRVTIPIDVSRIGITAPVLDPEAIVGTGIADLPRGNFGREVSPVYSGEPMRAEQVEKQAALAPGNSAPRYPEALRVAGVEGQVVATFIIGADGRYEQGSLRFLKSDNPLFERAVQTALLRMRFLA